MDHLFSIDELAAMHGVQPWQIEQLFESGRLSRPLGFAGKRVVSRQLLRRIREAAIERGWIKDQAAARGPAVDVENANRPNGKRGRPKKTDQAA